LLCGLGLPTIDQAAEQLGDSLWIFMHLGCDVSTADDGIQALAAASVDAFDLICLDRHMSGLSGDDVVSGLPRDQFVLAWSTDPLNLPRRFNGVLSKPVTAAAAQDAIARAIAWRTASAQRAALKQAFAAAA
jgi:CheY-like chemotaxis protein